MGAWQRRPLKALHFLAMVYAQFERDRCYQMASALTFSALLAVVPITAVSFALFNAFGAFAAIRNNVQQFLIRQLIPTSDLGQNLSHYLTEFTANTYQVTFVSLISLFVTAVTLFVTVEYSLGHIWSEKRHRSFIRNITIFTSILVWGPLLLGLSTYLSISMSTTAHSYVDPITGSELWNYLFPYATSVLMFFLGFTVLPAASVELRAALVGAASAGLLWEFAKYGFGVYIGRAMFYSNVYGSLSTVPVFLLWVYVSWLIFLYGAEVCYCFQYRRWLRMRGDGKRPGYTLQLMLALSSLMLVARRFRDGEPPIGLTELSAHLGIPEDVVGRSIAPLREAGLLLAVKGRTDLFVPPRSAESILVHEVFEAIHPPAEGLAHSDETVTELHEAAAVLTLLQEAQVAAVGRMTLASLLAPAAPGGPPAIGVESREALRVG